MPQGILGWILFSQWIMQRLALMLVIALAVAATAWTVAAAGGWAPWLRMQVGLGPAMEVEAGVAIQTALTLLLVGLCFFLPTNARIMQLERSHREFKVSMWDVARAYQAVHAADRQGAFELRSEFDSVRDRLTYLRQHAELGALEPEILEIAAQMSHESRDLAEVFSVDRVERARLFLRQRQEEAQVFQERVQQAQSTCRELKRWLEKVEIEEAVARSQLKRLEDDLEEILPELGLGLARKADAETLSFPIAAE